MLQWLLGFIKELTSVDGPLGKEEKKKKKKKKSLKPLKAKYTF